MSIENCSQHYEKIPPELYLKLFSEKSNAVFWVRDVTCKTQIYLSPAYEKVWGRSLDSLYKCPDSWIETIHPEDREANTAHMRLLIYSIHGQKANYENFYRIIRPDGETRWIKDVSFPIYLKNNKCIGFAGIAEDITTEKLNTIALIQARNCAENANRAKTEFLSNMAKDFRLLLKKFKSKKKSVDEFNEIFSDLENMATDIEGFAHFDLNVETSENSSEIISTGKAPTASVADLYKAHKHLGLSKRESESIYYLVRGMTLKQVAKQLGLSPRTVEFYVDNAKDKLGCMSKSELIAKIFSENLV